MIGNPNEIEKLFELKNNEFTIFIVDNSFVNNCGRAFFQKYLNTESWISTNSKLQKRIDVIVSWIHKNIPNMDEMLNSISKMKANTPITLKETLTSVTKLFGNTIHYAAGEKDNEIIIIEEEVVNKKTLTHFISLYKDSYLHPRIIIILKDDDFSKINALLSNCPEGTNLKYITNNNGIFVTKVNNTGANTIFDFLDYYTQKCFSTCSKTNNSILLSNDWSSNRIISDISPYIFKIRSTFLSEHKLNAIDDILKLDDLLDNIQFTNQNDRILALAFLCMKDLFKVYCYDFGGKELEEAQEIADELGSDILKAHVYRYSHFFDCSRERKQELLLEAEKIFENNNIADHAVYCKNNSIIHQFSMKSIKLNEFDDLEYRAINHTPGLALMAHIINNVGVAYLFERDIEKAIDEFSKGLEYVNNNHIQKLALKSNTMIANTFLTNKYDENYAILVLEEIYSPSLGLKRMTFLTAQFALNVIACALKQHSSSYKYLLNQYRIVDLIQTAFNTNVMGTGSMIAQMNALNNKYREFDLLDKLKLPNKTTSVSGIRAEYIDEYGLNPFFFNTWL